MDCEPRAATVAFVSYLSAKCPCNPNFPKHGFDDDHLIPLLFSSPLPSSKPWDETSSHLTTWLRRVTLPLWLCHGNKQPRQGTGFASAFRIFHDGMIFWHRIDALSQPAHDATSLMAPGGPSETRHQVEPTGPALELLTFLNRQPF